MVHLHLRAVLGGCIRAGFSSVKWNDSETQQAGDAWES